MPVTIKPGRLKYKDENGGYLPIDIIGSEDISAAVENYLEETLNLKIVDGAVCMSYQEGDEA